MKNTKGYKIKFDTKEIIITKKFSKAAGTIGTTEYGEMCKLRNDYGDFHIIIKSIEKKENKVAYKGLSVEEMRRFIKTNRSQDELDLFKKVVELQEGNKGKYAAVKKWFLDRYKDMYTPLSEELAAAAEKAITQKDAAKEKEAEKTAA
ncbi:MAG: hypothetical protein LUI12_07220 [Clostridiales bacterium]|nr:hypothetical protein [Clostridiales bacterium]